jgi:hypothetical protein
MQARSRKPLRHAKEGLAGSSAGLGARHSEGRHESEPVGERRAVD